MDRRTFLKLGLSAAGLTALELSGFALPTVRHVDRRNRKFHEPHTTLCPLCPTKCGLIAFTYLNELVQVEGNPIHPANEGKMCSRGVALKNLLFHPDRVTKPLKRANERGEDKWEKISWERAAREIQEKLAESKNIIFDSSSDSVPAAAAKILFELSAKIHTDARDGAFKKTSYRIFHHLLPAFRIEDCKTIILIGEPLSDRPVPFGLELANAKTKNNANVISIGPFCGKDAGRADWWIPTQTKDIPALLAATIVELTRRGVNAEKISGLKNVLSNLNAEKLLALHKIDYEIVKKLADRMYRVDFGFLFGPEILNSEGASLILELSWMLGWICNLQNTTVRFAREVPIRKYDELTDKTFLQRYDDLSQTSLIWHRANPTYRYNVSVELLKKAELIVAISPFVNESCAYADYILPEVTPLEDFHIDTSITPDFANYIFYGEPAVVPLAESKTLGEIMWLISPNSAKVQLPQSAESQTRWELDSLGLSSNQIVELKKNGFTKIEAPPIAARTINFNPRIVEKAFAVKPDEKKLELVTITHPAMGRDELSYQSKWCCEAAHKSSVWINSELAKKLGIKDGELIKVSSDIGEFEAQAWVSEAIHPKACALYSDVGRPKSRFAVAKPAKTIEPDSKLVWWTKETKAVEPNYVLSRRFDEQENLVSEAIEVELSKK